jgi:hypothetical protein
MTIWTGQSFERIMVDWIAATPRGLRTENGQHPGSRKGRDSVDLAFSKGIPSTPIQSREGIVVAHRPGAIYVFRLRGPGSVADATEESRKRPDCHYPAR